MTRKQNLILFILVPLWLTACGPKEFFNDMPVKFKVDSLTVLKDLFAGLSIKHLDDNVIEIRSTEPDLVPFAGVLEVRDGTVFYKQNEKAPPVPYLKLTAAKFDTLHVNYSDRRADEVVALGRVYDDLSKDSLYYFHLKPLKRISSSESIYIRSIALKNGEGIKYLTFGKDHYSVTIELADYPRVITQPAY